MKIIKTNNYDELSKKGAELLIEEIKKVERPVIGLATGSTPEGLYNEIIKFHKKTKYSFKNVYSFNLDEYIGLAEDNENSYHYYMNEKLFNHIDIPLAQAYVPDGMAEDLKSECTRYEEAIKALGGIDIQLLGLGVNGHIGFNEPGTSFDSRTQIITLEKSTRNANAHFFSSGGEVPEKAISMGVQSIMDTKKIVLLVSGKNKAAALKRFLTEDVTEDFPATILHKHHDVTVIADKEALSELE
ncbi:MAG TPA: glucosamine-6-phosphate deaminase [Pseudogracilibacillus sp.]|nr:glucosamine-6-phosphate deaminase [Pseudogracilibacillus sp.]